MLEEAHYIESYICEIQIIKISEPKRSYHFHQIFAKNEPNVESADR